MKNLGIKQAAVYFCLLPYFMHWHRQYICVCAYSVPQSCPTLCNPMGYNPSGSTVHGILQERILEWVAISFSNACMHAKSLQLCLQLCDPVDSSPPGSSVPGIFQARILEWAAISFSNACMHAKSLQLCPTLCDPIDSSPPGSSVHGIL